MNHFSPCHTLNVLFSVSLLHLCLCPGTRTRVVILEKCCPTSICPPSKATSCSFSWCVIIKNPWSALQPSSCWYLRHTHQPLVFWDSTPPRGTNIHNGLGETFFEKGKDEKAYRMHLPLFASISTLWG